MSAPVEDPLPPGWDTKFDPRTGRYYYINHYTKSTSWEDPRIRYKQIGQAASSSSQGTSGVVAGLSSSTSAANSNECVIDKSKSSASAASSLESQKLRTSLYSSASTSRQRNFDSANVQPYPLGTIAPTTKTTTECAESSTFSLEASSTDGMLRKYGSGSPIPSGRVSSAIGFGSGGLTGPTGPPIQPSPLPLQRIQLEEGSGIFGHGSNTAAGSSSPISQRSGIRRESHLLTDISEEDNHEQSLGTISAMFPTVEETHIRELLKKYLKSVFPTVEEYLLLDVLSNSDNNVQKAADRLVKMGYVKRDTPSAPRLHARRKEEERLAEKRTPLPKPPPIKSDREKDELRKKMKDKYEKKFDIPERILYMALESVLYDEDQAVNLINSMIEDDLKRKKAKEIEKVKEKEKKKSPKPTRRALDALERHAKHTSPKHEPKKNLGGSKKSSHVDDRTTQGTSTCDGGSNSQKSSLAKGPNQSLCVGPNDDLLLTDYVTWNGPNPDLANGVNKNRAQGPKAELRQGPRSLAKGKNPNFFRGPNPLLALGSKKDFFCEANGIRNSG